MATNIQIDTFEKRLAKAFIDSFGVPSAENNFQYVIGNENGKSKVSFTAKQNETVVMAFTIADDSYGKVFGTALRLVKAWKPVTRVSAKQKAQMEAEASNDDTPENEE